MLLNYDAMTPKASHSEIIIDRKFPENEYSENDGAAKFSH